MKSLLYRDVPGIVRISYCSVSYIVRFWSTNFPYFCEQYQIFSFNISHCSFLSDTLIFLFAYCSHNTRSIHVGEFLIHIALIARYFSLGTKIIKRSLKKHEITFTVNLHIMFWWYNTFCIVLWVKNWKYVPRFQSYDYVK